MNIAKHLENAATIATLERKGKIENEVKKFAHHFQSLDYQKDLFHQDS